jgi:tubulin alpha
LPIGDPKYTNLNELIAQAVSSITVFDRFAGEQNHSLNKLQMNLITEPNMSFPLVSYAPFISAENINQHQEQLSLEGITNASFEPANHMLQCDLHKGRYVTCCMLYRGDVALNAVYGETAALVRDHFKDRDTYFTVDRNNKPPAVVPGSDLANVPRAVCKLANNTAIARVFAQLGHKFDLMYAKRAFVHWYVHQGMEEGELSVARNDLSHLVNVYEEADLDAV